MSCQFFKTQVIGDFPEAEARLYLEQNMGASTTDAEWAQIFEVRLQAYDKVSFCSVACFTLNSGRGMPRQRSLVALPCGHVQVCGGNAGDLLRAIGQYAVFKDWTRGGLIMLCVIIFRAMLSRGRTVNGSCHATALEEVWHNPMEDVLAGLRGRPGWSAAQYSTVLQHLLQTPSGAVVADKLYAQLPPDKRAAEMAVQAMVQADLLSYRPPSGVCNLQCFAVILSNPACP